MACSEPDFKEYAHLHLLLCTSFFLTMVFKCRLKALVAIPKVQPRFAVAIWKKYPTMRSLLNAYMDPSKSVST